MKIDIERFGPIERFSYNLEKDMIVTYGNNNIGKSYSMQIVYLLLKTFIGYPYHRQFGNMYFMPRGMAVELSENNNLEKIVQDFMDSSEPIKDITNVVVCEVYNALKNAFLDEFMNSCENTFGNLDKTLADEPMIHIHYGAYKFFIDLKKRKMEGSIDIKPIFLKKTESDFHKSRKCKERLDIYVVSDIKQPVHLIIEQIVKYLSSWFHMVRRDYENVYFLPASRSGIYSGMNAFGSIVAELSKNRAYFTKKIEFPGISEPISDYFISLSNINKTRLNENLEEYYTEIEDSILKGKVTFDKTKNTLMYKPNNMDAYYEMTEVSSMVSEVSPIVAFLKYILAVQGKKAKRGKAVLFIEEPEAHLHPNNQIRLIEVFAKIVKVDVKLIISSHSNYVFNKLNNLVLGNTLDYHVYQPIILEEHEEGSVSKFLDIDELGADDENFMDVSEALYCEREEIIQRMNMEE